MILQSASIPRCKKWLGITKRCMLYIFLLMLGKNVWLQKIPSDLWILHDFALICLPLLPYIHHLHFLFASLILRFLFYNASICFSWSLFFRCNENKNTRVLRSSRSRELSYVFRFFSHDNVDFSLELYGDSLNRLHPKFYVPSRVKLSREARWIAPTVASRVIVEGHLIF